MPGEQGIGGDQRLNLTKGATTKGPGLRGQTPALRIREAKPTGGKLFPQDAILFLEIVNDVTLLLVDPAGHGDDEALQRLGNGHIAAERSRARLFPLHRSPLQTDGAVELGGWTGRSVSGQYGLHV